MIKSNLLDSKLLSKIYCKQCIICGKNFGVKVNRDGLIETDCFHTRLNKRYFTGWGFNVTNLVHTRYFKNNYYKIVGFSKWSRYLYYNLWMLIYGWKKWDYWECPRCSNRPDDI